jgi:pyrroloquinoline quinone biosynthesis protein B
VILRILGSAAGGGVPQWNCTCRNCSAARAGLAPRRTQCGAAISAGGDRWLLLNCSPDIAAQIEAYDPLGPNALRGTPIDGMLFTDANVDHMGGLATLRQSGPYRFVVRSSECVRDIALTQPAFAPFASPPHRWISVTGEWCAPADEADEVGHALRVRAFDVPGTTPGYDGRRRERGAVVAYEISTRDERERIVFAPVFGDINDALAAAIDRATIAVLDGTFYSDDELRAQGLMDKAARDLGHLPVGGPGGSLERLGREKPRIVFTHVNNSNPMLDSGSNAAEAVREFGAEIAYDGMML